MATKKNDAKQKVTINLDRQTLRTVRIIAARRSMSISRLLAHQIEILVEKEEAYELAESQATVLLDEAFHLGGVIRATRDELHDRGVQAEVRSR
jgi:hypothetical protein